MKRLVVTAMGCLAWLFAGPAIGVDNASPATVRSALPSTQQNLPPAASPTANHPATKELLAGLADRARALDLAAQLDELDYEELAVWEQIIPPLSAGVLAPDAREQESTMRLGTLPLLAARQAQYRALEFELGRGLLAASDPGQLTNGMQIARLASIRDWSDLVAQAQRQTRTTLDTVHAVALARATKAGVRLDATSLAALSQIRERRGRIESAFADASTAWEASRETARLEQRQQDLGLAAAVAQAAAHAESSSDDLNKRAAEASLPASLRVLLRTTAQVLHRTARVQGRWAADQIKTIDWQSEGFLTEPGDVDAADVELTTLLAQRHRLVTALRASLAARVATLTDLQSLAAQRARVLANADYLAPTEDQRRAYLTLQQATTQTWAQVDALRVTAGIITSAGAGERALAAELLGGELEELVLLEDQLQTLAIGRLLDLTPRPADPRLAAAATKWQDDIDALQTIDGQQAAWRKVWDELGAHEDSQLAALRLLTARVNDLWAVRIGLLAKALPRSSVDDDVSRLATTLVNDASAHARTLPGMKRNLDRAHEEGEADPVVGAVFKSAGAFRWSLASAGLRDLPGLFHQVAQLRGAQHLLPVALSPALPAAQRLGALMSLSEALGVPWLALGSGPDLQVFTEVAGDIYQLEGLPQNAPLLRRQREVFVDAPMRFMAVSMNGLQLAQTGLPSGQPEPSNNFFISPDHPMLSPVPGTLGLVPMSPRTLTLIAHHTVKEVFENRWIYFSMPFAGLAGGAVQGARLGPRGAYLGGKVGGVAGLIAVTPAVAEDAAFGGLKGLIKGTAADFRRLLPAQYSGSRNLLTWIEQHTESSIDAAQAAIGLSSLVKQGIKAVGGGQDKAVTAQRLTASVRGSITEGQQSLAALSRQIGADIDRLTGGQILSAAERQALANSLSAAYARTADIRKLVVDLRARVLPSVQRMRTDWIGSWGREAAEMIATMNDTAGPDQSYARDLLASIVQSIRAQVDPTASSSQTSTGQGAGASAADPEGDKALQGFNAREQHRSTGQVQRSAATVTVQEDRPSSDKLLESLDTLQREMVTQWEDKKERERLRLIQEKEKKDKENRDGGTTVQDEIKKPVKPDTPAEATDPSKTEPSGPEQKYWYGFDAVISYLKFRRSKNDVSI